jgi:RNA 2',3'-cyclic 3'-phosphodiesterase
MRLFVAAWPDASTVEILEGLRPPQPAPEVRWVGAANWHVTLCFLGSVPDREIHDLVEVLVAAAGSCAPATARLGPAIRLLGKGVLCVPVEGLHQLARIVTEATAPFSRSADRDRPFRGHLTLARSVGRRAIPRQAAGSAVSADWLVDAFLLVRSTTGSRGSIYDTRGVFPLGGPPPSRDEHVFGYTVRNEHRLPDTPPP